MVKQLTVISGKGGTGKTTFTSSFAALAENAVIADCDVDAADMHLILQPEISEIHNFFGLDVASINKELCTACGICVSSCRFDAIDSNQVVDTYKCEGCGVCEHVCPEDAVSMIAKKAGEYYCSNTRFGPLVHAKLGIGEEASGKLVSDVRRRASELAEQSGKDLIVIDGPPGTGCAVIAAITGTDLVLVVTEPTKSGVHDLERVVQVAQHFRIPVAVCINKYDINKRLSVSICEYCKDNNIPVLGMLPYDNIVIEAMIAGSSVVEYSGAKFSEGIRSVWNSLVSILFQEEKEDIIRLIQKSEK
ncbi:MinD superfamily P-loop ATPase, contains an inserted ferredoxin domain [Methanolobus vulcani]|jgi:MinD superfamily P-loop ATPase containing an inserted ferredoxin domain|uniref:MinD superfamily P-loop ATPase, contains an inserted ferredoxin domain n=1 Tax=Methanolobus vulcani TaxID=38026 RepID=A0A7Z7FDU5_9EURY|nr:MinD superfamily P-loop ATPase, contains an inserted ferredoxin domain [Methanolobus vulcani]